MLGLKLNRVSKWGPDFGVGVANLYKKEASHGEDDIACRDRLLGMTLVM